MKALWNLFSIIAVFGTYYGAWRNDWIIILVCAIPQMIGLGYSLAKGKTK